MLQLGRSTGQDDSAKIDHAITRQHGSDFASDQLGLPAVHQPLKHELARSGAHIVADDSTSLLTDQMKVRLASSKRQLLNPWRQAVRWLAASSAGLEVSDAVADAEDIEIRRPSAVSERAAFRIR